MADGNADLLDKNEEGSAVESGAMNLACRPIVIGCDDEQKQVGDERCADGIAKQKGERPAGDGGDGQAAGGNKDQALVSGRIGASAKGKKDEDGEDQHVRQRNDVEKFDVAARGSGGTHERIGCRQNAEDDHETSEQEAGDAETAVDVNAACGDQRGLRY